MIKWISYYTIIYNELFTYCIVIASIRYLPPPLMSSYQPNKTELETSTSESLNFTGAAGHDPEDFENSYTELQTIILTCIATVVPLILILACYFLGRFFYKKYQQRQVSSYDSALNKDESSGPLTCTNGNVSTVSTEEMKITESQFLVKDDSRSSFSSKKEPDIECIAGGPSPILTTYSSRGSKVSANGSIITMTLKNNHLIVETEERPIPSSTTKTSGQFSFSGDQMKALVHYSPDNESKNDLIAQRRDSKRTLPDTKSGSIIGLSQSNLSESSNTSYKYGNQQGYDVGHYGVAMQIGYSTDGNGSNNCSEISKVTDVPVITSAIYKDLQRNLNDLKSGNSADSSSMPYGPLLSDIQIKKICQDIHDEQHQTTKLSHEKKETDETASQTKSKDPSQGPNESESSNSSINATNATSKPGESQVPASIETPSKATLQKRTRHSSTKSTKSITETVKEETAQEVSTSNDTPVPKKSENTQTKS